jgi:hypothetical protein
MIIHLQANKTHPSIEGKKKHPPSPTYEHTHTHIYILIKMCSHSRSYAIIFKTSCI